MYEGNLPQRRYNLTKIFLRKHFPNNLPLTILDLGEENPLGNQLKEEGFQIEFSGKDDLDDYIFTSDKKFTCCTAFEILEHLFNPYTVLKNLPSHYICVTVPLSLWFATPYRNLNDIRDQHFHEFYDWQFDALLNKCGWDILATEKWTNPTSKIGIRPILRNFYPRYYAVFAQRKS